VNFLNLKRAKFYKKCAKLPLLSAEGCHSSPYNSAEYCSLHYPLRIYHRVFFSSEEKSSEDINSHLFLMNKKGLRVKANIDLRIMPVHTFKRLLLASIQPHMLKTPMKSYASFQNSSLPKTFIN
jgi:hypothetical protein